MTDPFEELLDSESMSRINETAPGRETAPTAERDAASSPEQVREALTGRHVCPFCGLQAPDNNEPCPRCRMDDTPGSRQATKVRIGPWFVLQVRNPAAPGMKYATLMHLIAKGSVLPQSVVRGPTTHQLWRYAAHVRGVSREFGLCYSCGGSIERAATTCPYCSRSQEPPPEPDQLLDARNGSSSASAVAPVPTPVPEPAASSAIVPLPAPSTAEGSFSNRMRELSRQRDKAEQESANGLATVQRSQRPSLPRGNGERVVSAMDLAAALQEDPNRFVGESRGWGLLKSAAAFLLFSGAIGAAVLYAKPEYQTPAKNWVGSTWASVKGMVNRAVAPTPAAMPMRERAAVVVAPPPARSPSIMSPAVAELSPSHVDPDSAPIAQAPSEPAEPRVSPTPAPAPVVTSPTAPSEAPVIASSDPTDRATAINTARQLYRQAIDAEQKEDFATAIRFYEQIEKLPNDAWPTDLRIRISIVRQQASQSSAAQ